jgi:hypothetical protein
MLYLHIGLHKTATSSLQKVVFPNLKNIHYVGRHFGGWEFHTESYKKIADYIHNDHHVKRLQCAKAELDKLFGRYNDVLLSDEWITANYSLFKPDGSVTWQAKVNNLRRLLQEFDFKVACTLRDPVKCIYSQFLEFNRLGLSYAYNFDDYLKSNDALAYQYVEFDLFLRSQLTNVTYLKFEDLVINDFTRVEKFFGQPIANTLPIVNEKRKRSNRISVEKYPRFVYAIKRLLPIDVYCFLTKSSLFSRLIRQVGYLKTTDSFEEISYGDYREKFSISYDFFDKI